MRKKVATPRWFSSRRQQSAVANRIAPKFYGLRRIQWFACAILLLFFVIAIFRIAIPNRRDWTVDVGSDDLLLRLAELSRGGSDLLCDARNIEKKLVVQIKNAFADKKGEGLFLIADASAQNSIFGTYSKFRVGENTVCRLQLQFALHRFCNTDNAWTQRLLGRRVQPGMQMVGEAGFYDHGYEFGRKPLERSVIAWRHSTRSCSADVEVASTNR